MNSPSRFVIAAAMAFLPCLAGAEGKCNDDPFLLPDGTLGVTWTIPMLDAKVDRNPTGTLLSDLDALFGGEPEGLPPEYRGAAPYELPNHARTDQKHASSDEVKRWLENADFHLTLAPEHKAALDQYFAGQQCARRPGAAKPTCSITGVECDAKPCAKVVSYGWVVRHPQVANNGSGYVFCTCTLQRAALVFHGDKEELWVRTRFRSATRDGRSVNFVPLKPVVFTFETKRMWFPLALNRLLPEAGKPGFLFLDVLTRAPLDLNKIPAGFSVRRMEQTIAYDRATWHVTRIWRTYQPGAPAADLLIEP